MAVFRSVARAIGRLSVLTLVALLAVWIVWSWPWAPLMWLAVSLVFVGITYAARRASERRSRGRSRSAASRH